VTSRDIIPWRKELPVKPVETINLKTGAFEDPITLMKIGVN